MKKIATLFVLSTVLLLIGCKKSQVRNNLEGNWTISVLSVNNFNQVTTSTSLTLNISNVTRKGGDIRLEATNTNGTVISTGTFLLNKEHTEIDATLISTNSQVHWEGDLIVDETNLEISGVSSDNIGTAVSLFELKGFK